MNLSVNDSGYSGTSTTQISADDTSLNVFGISATLVCVMGFTLFGNGLVLLAFYVQPSLRKVIYFPIISLALADLLCAVTAMPLYIVKKNISSSINERLVCDFYRFSYFFTEYASIMSLMAISIERLLIIYNPLKYRNFISPHVMIAGLIVCWLEALVVSSMPFYWRSDRKENCTNSPTANWSLMVITANVFAPFLIMLSCHCYIYTKTLRTFDCNDAQERNQELCVSRQIIRAENWKMERKATISFSIVIGVFVICWGPSTLYYFLRNLCPECFGTTFKPMKDAFSAAMKILTFTNSFMNPIIYFWLNIDFRRACIRVLKREWATRSRSGTVSSITAIMGNFVVNIQVTTKPKAKSKSCDHNMGCETPRELFQLEAQC